MNHGWQSEPTDGLKGRWSVGPCICLSTCVPVYLFICLSVCLSICLSISLAICLAKFFSIYLCVDLTIHLAIFPPIYLSICLSVYLSVYLSICLSIPRKIVLANLKVCCSKMNPLSRNQRPDLSTCLPEMSLVLRLPCEMHLFRSSSNVPCLLSFLQPLQNLHLCLTHFLLSAELLAPARKNDARTSKSGAIMWCFEHFHFKMCFAPQRRSLFQHLNFEKCCEPTVFCTHFDIEMCFAPQRRSCFQYLNWQELRTCGIATILTSKCASCQSGVHSFNI